jgi:hypothetical protein
MRNELIRKYKQKGTLQMNLVFTKVQLHYDRVDENEEK